MTDGRYSRRNATYRPTGARRSDRENNFFFGILGFSLFLHIIVAAIFLYHPTSATQRRPPTLSVDLVMAPVANPQRGSASAIRKLAAPVAVPKPPSVLPAKVAKDQTKAAPKSTTVRDDDIAADIKKMKRRMEDQAEQDDAQAAIAALKKKTTQAPAAAPVGSPTGTGDEAGSAIDAWLQKAVKAKWNWAGRKRKDLSAEVEVEFDTAGKLSNYRFIRSSGEALFDKSLKDALLKLEPLPRTMREPYKNTILFNLDELQGP